MTSSKSLKDSPRRTMGFLCIVKEFYVYMVTNLIYVLYILYIKD